MNSPPPGVAPRPNALRVNVLLPAGYDGKRQFPVLCLLHGAAGAYDYWANPAKGDLVDIARNLKAVVVMPEGAVGWYTNWWNGGQRANPAWESYHLDELIPLVEHRLRIRPERRWHAIAGLSMGGVGALFYASQRPGYFGTVASFSGPISMQRPEWPAFMAAGGYPVTTIWGDPVAQAFYWTGHNPTSLVANLRNSRVYVSVGDGVPQNDADRAVPGGAAGEAYSALQAQDFVAAARAAGVDVTFRPHPGIHDWPYWRRDLANMIQWGLFSAVPRQPRTWVYKTVERRSDAFGYHFTFVDGPPTTVETFTRDGEILTATGSGHVLVRTPDGKRFIATLPFERSLTCEKRTRARCKAARPREELRDAVEAATTSAMQFQPAARIA